MSSEIKIIHFRKFVSRKMVNIILDSCINLKKVSLSRYASSKCSSEIIDYMSEKGLQIQVSNRSIGRPNLLERGDISNII